jgi:hypothetical protein
VLGNRWFTVVWSVRLHELLSHVCSILLDSDKIVASLKACQLRHW